MSTIRVEEAFEPVGATNPDVTRRLIRQMNKRQLLRIAFGHSTITRVELADLSGLSKQTVSEIMRELLAEGLMRDAGRLSGGVGRRPHGYEFNSGAGHVVAADLGASRLRVAVADLRGKILGERAVFTTGEGEQRVLAQINDVARAVVRETGVDWASVRSATIGTPGVIDPSTGHVTMAANIRGFDSVPVQGLLESLLGIPTNIDNDVNLAVRGELSEGLGRTRHNLVFIAIGNGVGMGVVVDGDIRRGATGAAGEIGFLPIGHMTRDRTAAGGVFESAVAARGLLQRYRELGGTADDVPSIFESLETGERAAHIAIEETAGLVANAVLSVASVLDPEVVVLGGGIGSRPELVARINARSLVSPRPVAVVATALGERATLVGAVAHAADSAHEAIFGPGRVASEYSPARTGS